jgi:hypothetical protein
MTSLRRGARRSTPPRWVDRVWRRGSISDCSRTRRPIDLETHRDIFTWVLERLGEAGLVQGKTVAIDATTLEANAALRSIVRRDTGESYRAFLTTPAARLSATVAGVAIKTCRAVLHFRSTRD